MPRGDSRSLIPMPARGLVKKDQTKAISPSNLNSQNHEFATREDVRKYLPDILGRVLARIWIDTDFNNAFAQNPTKTLSRHGVHLPENIVIEFQKQDSERPRVVVFEQNPGSKFKLRIFYLQLVMMAGR